MTCRITGKKTNPHLVRDSIVTYLRSTGASERELEALAIYMGHSLEMQRGTYDRSARCHIVSCPESLTARGSRLSAHSLAMYRCATSSKCGFSEPLSRKQQRVGLKCFAAWLVILFVCLRLECCAA